MTGTGAPARPLRADAVRNRARILAAAAEVFAERGLDVTLDDIATHAGLGVGTVYRRFADREALVEALFDERMQATIARLNAALQVPAEDAWEALVGVIRETCEDFARDRGLRQVMLSSVHGHKDVARCRIEIGLIVERLVDRAKATGRLRQDFQATDVPVLFLMVGTIADFASPVAPDLWRRYFDMLVDGIRAQPDGARGLTVVGAAGGTEGTICSALGREEMLSAMEHWRPAAHR
jgi:AcrR family transcriptional regulator